MHLGTWKIEDTYFLTCNSYDARLVENLLNLLFNLFLR